MVGGVEYNISVQLSSMQNNVIYSREFDGGINMQAGHRKFKGGRRYCERETLLCCTVLQNVILYCIILLVLYCILMLVLYCIIIN